MTRPLAEIARLFLKLGTISFGGPAAHLAVMEQEVVAQRGWISREEFLDLMAATNLIPGPNAVEMAAHLGYRRAGWVGSIVAGLAFTLPAVAISLVLAVGYVRFGSLPQVQPFLDGIKPAVLGIIFAAVCRLGSKALRTWQLVLVGSGVTLAVLCGMGEIWALLAGSLLGLILLRLTRTDRPNGTSPDGPPSNGPSKRAGVGLLVGLTVAGFARVAKAAWSSATGWTTTFASATLGTAPVDGNSLWSLGLFFLKVGAVLYGGGYVLLAYLEGDLVNQYEQLTEKVLLDAVAVGQLTPGPLLSTVTFIGYRVAGYSGAAVATTAMLLPSFVFVAAVNPLIPRLRRSAWASRFLDAVGAASIGLMAAVTITLGRLALVDLPGWLIAVAAATLALRWKVAPAWLVLGAAMLGWLAY